MELLSKQERSGFISDDIVYQFDSLSNSEDLTSLIKMLHDEGYVLKRYVINYIQDHADFKPNIGGDNIEEMFNVLNNGMIDVESVDLSLLYDDIGVCGTLYPDSGVFRLSFQKKNNTVSHRKI